MNNFCQWVKESHHKQVWIESGLALPSDKDCWILRDWNWTSIIFLLYDMKFPPPPQPLSLLLIITVSALFPFLNFYKSQILHFFPQFKIKYSLLTMANKLHFSYEVWLSNWWFITVLCNLLCTPMFFYFCFFFTIPWHTTSMQKLIYISFYFINTDNKILLYMYIFNFI